MCVQLYVVLFFCSSPTCVSHLVLTSGVYLDICDDSHHHLCSSSGHQENERDEEIKERDRQSVTHT